VYEPKRLRQKIRSLNTTATAIPVLASMAAVGMQPFRLHLRVEGGRDDPCLLAVSANPGPR
jgi:hypothetical protein